MLLVNYKIRRCIAVIRRSTLRASVLVQLPPLLSTSYLSCILRIRYVNRAEQYTIFCFHCIVHTAILWFSKYHVPPGFG
jgi:hypothetical protein